MKATMTLGSVGLLSAMLSLSALAADHRDGPLASGDPAADLNDVYLFINPNDADELIVVGTAFPDAPAAARFSDAVEFRFHIDNGAETNIIRCNFSEGGGKVLCRGVGDILYAEGFTGGIVDADELRVFTGLTDDPFFFDGPQFNAIRTGQAAGFRNPGVNAFADFNTLSIVLGIQHFRLTNNGANPVLKVWASSHRLEGDGVSAGHSGMWYDVGNPGHGILLQALAEGALGPGSPRSMVAYWNVFDNDGDQLAVYGIGTIDGESVSIPVVSGEGGAFPPAVVRGMGFSEPAFGTLNFTFSGCNSATMQVVPTRAGFQETTINLTRLTFVENTACSFFESGQIDRNGRPAINTALIESVTPNTGLKDVYNRSGDPAEWAGLFTQAMVDSLTILDTVDGTTGNALLPPATLASVLVDDRLIIDTRIAECGQYLAVELGLTTACGGRTLDRDVIDDSLGAIVGPGVSDNVGFQSTILDAFPFLAPPQ